MKAWSTARVQNEAKTKVDATARAHGESISMLNCDWTSLMRKFREQYGKHLKDEDLPAQSYYEQFEESLADGCLQAERLTHVVSARESSQTRTGTPAWSPPGFNSQSKPSVGSCQRCRQRQSSSVRNTGSCRIAGSSPKSDNQGGTCTPISQR